MKTPEKLVFFGEEKKITNIPNDMLNFSKK